MWGDSSAQREWWCPAGMVLGGWRCMHCQGVFARCEDEASRYRMMVPTHCEPAGDALKYMEVRGFAEA